MPHGKAVCLKQFTPRGDRRQRGQVLREVLGLAHGDNTFLLYTRVVIPCGDQVDQSDNIVGSSASYAD